MVANDLFGFASFQFFNESWVIMGDFEHINIAEIKIVEFCLFFCFVLFVFVFVFFPASPKC